MILIMFVRSKVFVSNDRILKYFPDKYDHCLFLTKKVVRWKFSKTLSTQLFTVTYKKLLWQNGSTLASHAIGPGFKSKPRQMSFW